MKVSTLSVLVHVLALSLTEAARLPRHEKFTSWFPLVSRGTFEGISSGLCNATLANYTDAFRKRDNLRDLGTACSIHQICIINNTRGDIAARLQSANVLLGLTPVLLGQLGPSVAEISLLATERPLLSLLLSSGSPVVYIERVLKYRSPLEAVHDNHATITSFQALRKFPVLQSLVSVTQYVFAAAAVANVIYTSFELGIRTTMSFSCNNWFWPLTWTLMSFFVYLPAALNWDRLMARSKGSRRPENGDNFGIAFLKKETSLCLAHEIVVPDPKSDEAPSVMNDPKSDEAPSVMNVVSNYLATFLGFLHITFGTLIFSSVTFIEILDVFTVILRYMASAVVCRAVLSFELAGIRDAIVITKEPKDLPKYGGPGTGATQQGRPNEQPEPPSQSRSLSDQDTV